MTTPSASLRWARGYVRVARGDSLVRNSLYLMLTTVETAGLGYVFWIVAARMFSTAQVGIASAVISLCSTVALLTYLGPAAMLVERLHTYQRPRAWKSFFARMCVATAAVTALLATVTVPLIAHAKGYGSYFSAAGAAVLAVTGAAVWTVVQMCCNAFIAARRAVRALGDHEVAVPAAAARMALAAADILAESDHGAVCRLRDSIVTLVERRQPQPPGLSVAAEVEGLEKNCMRLSGLHWVLDPGLAPRAPFRPGLSPYSDLLVRHEPSAARLVVSATPATGVTRETAEMWHVRLVDPTVRRVLAVAVFEEDGSRAQAQLRLPFPLHELSEAWVEVTDRSDRPVQGVKLHRRRRALRWADAALRAERAPAGLAPGATAADWAALAAAAWEWCYRDWTMADDPERAMAALAPRLPSQDPVCIAEILGE